MYIMTNLDESMLERSLLDAVPDLPERYVIVGLQGVFVDELLFSAQSLQ